MTTSEKEKRTTPTSDRTESLTIGGIHVEFSPALSLREIEYVRLVLIAYVHANTVLDATGKMVLDAVGKVKSNPLNIPGPDSEPAYYG